MAQILRYGGRSWLFILDLNENYKREETNESNIGIKTAKNTQFLIFIPVDFLYIFTNLSNFKFEFY